MAWHSSPHSASNAITFTLREAAQQLGIDLKTLRKKMELLGIVPVADPRDRRALLITDEQFEELARHLNQPRRSALESPPAERSLESMLIDVVKARERDLDMLSAALSERDQAIAVLSERERALTQQIDKLAEIISSLDTDLRPRISAAIKESPLAYEARRTEPEAAPDDQSEMSADEDGDEHESHARRTRNGTGRARVPR